MWLPLGPRRVLFSDFPTCFAHLRVIRDALHAWYNACLVLPHTCFTCLVLPMHAWYSPCMLWPHSVIRNNYLIWRQRSNPNDAPAGASGTGHVDGFEALTLGSGQLRHRLRPLLPRVHAWFGPMPHLDVLVGVPIVCPMLTGARIVHAIGCGARLPPVTVGCDCDCAVTVPVMCL